MIIEFKIVSTSVKLVIQQLYFKIACSDKKPINPIVHSAWPHSDWREVITILPLPNYLVALNNVFKVVGESIVHENNLRDYIQMSRFIEQQNLDRLSCDWCSIVNGSLEFVLDSIGGNKASDINKLNTAMLTLMHNMLLGLTKNPGRFPDNDYSVYDSEVDAFIENKKIVLEFGEYVKLKNTIKKFLELKKLVEAVETRWCPFRYLSDIAYERNYWGTDVEGIAELLRTSGRITCESCVPTVNSLYAVTTPKSSVFEDYVNNLFQLSDNKIPNCVK